MNNIIPAPARDLVILGPTCSWKSQVASMLAKHLGGEVVSCDSMQVYRTLEIGTAQPLPESMLDVPHHLVGNMDIEEQYDVNIFLSRAKEILEQIHSRGRNGIVAGGTGLYAKALVYGLSLLPSSPEVQERIREEMDTPSGRQKLELHLAEAAGGRDNIPSDVLLNPRRLARAYEVLELTGKPPWLHHNGNKIPDSNFIQFIILPDFSLLKERIRLRTAKMLEYGWFEEAKEAISRGLMNTPTARQALGYRDIADFIEGRGLAKSMEQLPEVLSNRTIQYARRQLTWFKHQHPGAVFIDVKEEDDAAVYITDCVLRYLRQGYI